MIVKGVLLLGPIKVISLIRGRVPHETNAVTPSLVLVLLKMRDQLCTKLWNRLHLRKSSVVSPSQKPVEAGAQAEVPVHDLIIPTTKNTKEAIRLQAMWRGHEVRTWVQAASVVRSIKWDFTTGATQNSGTAGGSPSGVVCLNGFSLGSTQSSAKTGGSPVGSSAVSNLPARVSRRQMLTPRGSAQERLLGKSGNKKTSIQLTAPTTEEPVSMPISGSMAMVRTRELPATQKKSSATCVADEYCHRGGGGGQSVPVAPSDANLGGRQPVGQLRTETPPQLGIPLATTSRSCSPVADPNAADVAEGSLITEAFPSFRRSADLVGAGSPDPVSPRPREAPEAGQHPLVGGAQKLDSSPPADQSDRVQDKDNGNYKPCSTEETQARNDDVLEASSPSIVSKPTGLAEEPCETGANIETQNDESGPPRATQWPQGVATGTPHHLEDILESNATDEQAPTDCIAASNALSKESPIEIEGNSSAGPCVQHSKKLEASSWKRTKRHPACSVAPFVPFVVRPTKAAQHRGVERAEPQAENNEQNEAVKSEGAVSGLGRRVSVALRNAHSIFGTTAPAGRQQHVQRQPGYGVSYAAVGWLRGRSSDEAADVKGESAEKQEAITQSMPATSVEEHALSSISCSQPSMLSTPPAVARNPAAWQVGEVSVDESDRQTLASETKRWGRRFTTVNTQEPRVLGTGPALNPFRRTHRTEEYVEKQLQPIPRRK
ncbi:hypothetical protein, conserved [Eimeria praecox]|uniref:Uncharacterized protein n=1 Tax=Eimeria praecox TaxID=51316 RepID=U6G785_9EIME|nr:hypothetical protein, conserved [Eimeria praecox]